MKLKIKWLGICMMFILSSCRSVDYLNIQTYNPAKITFPEEVRKVLIVNNAVTPDADEVYVYKLYGHKPELKSVQKDSAMVEAIQSLGYNIADASYFDDVLLYNDKLNDTDRISVSEELSPLKVRELCQTTGADAVISWDRLTFNTHREVVAYIEGFIEEFIDIDVEGTLRAYLPDRKTPLATIIIEDSLSLSDIADDLFQMKQIMPPTDIALCMATEYIAKKQVGNFVPHWQNESRWVYNEGTSRWKEAAAYMSEGRWDKAAERWKYLYEQSSGWEKKAKAASNLALYYEMNTDLKTAYEWAEKCFELLKEHKNEEESRLFEMQKLYLNVLNQRLELNKKLNMQIGAE